jgi:hypothetical protein
LLRLQHLLWNIKLNFIYNNYKVKLFLGFSIIGGSYQPLCKLQILFLYIFWHNFERNKKIFQQDALFLCTNVCKQRQWTYGSFAMDMPPIFYFYQCHSLQIYVLIDALCLFLIWWMFTACCFHCKLCRVDCTGAPAPQHAKLWPIIFGPE